MLLTKKMKIHCDWNDPNSSMAVTFDDEEGEATESFQDFSCKIIFFIRHSANS